MSIKRIYTSAGFKPNASQAQAIRHQSGPLFLTAGPGSGKTRVLLWRTLGLIVDRQVKPEEIFLGTFTEKAALQLKEGLRTYLGIASNITNQRYDISKMYVGTVHSLCQKLLTDRRLHPSGQRPRPPALLDDLDQYLHLSRAWKDLLQPHLVGTLTAEDLHQAISAFAGGQASQSKHSALSAAISLFNRFSEESLTPSDIRKKLTKQQTDLHRMADLYEAYLATLTAGAARVDFSLLQQEALRVLEGSPAAGGIFRHIIVDEYQDTNAIQERLFFTLAQGHKNLCVVGDDDQALYRFRGATVDNFVEFPQRCQTYLKQKPTRIDLDTNYRSREPIVDFYGNFMSRMDWRDPPPEQEAMTDAEIEARLRELFEENYELLLAEGGHALSPEVKNAALNQVLLYWRKHRSIATQVTDTEVLLVLPDQVSPQRRKYTIEGVVDIVREQGRTLMYDIKTHDADYVRSHLDLYEGQINVYAHIWQNLRNQQLDETAIIATSYPLPVRRALQPPVDQAKLDQAVAAWDPVVPIPFDQKKVQATIKDFGATVDAIENHDFCPPAPAKLKGKSGARGRTFGQDVCGSCDGRFSCASYRGHVQQSGHAGDSRWRAFMLAEDEQERNERLDANLPDRG